MGIVVTYVRLSPEQLEHAAQDPEVVFRLDGEEEDPVYRGAETLYLDKAYKPICWLLSPLARAEEDHLTKLIKNPNEPEAAARARVAAINAMPIDPAFEAIYGSRSHVDERFDIGLDLPAVMAPERVRMLSAALDGIARADLDRTFDREEMIQAGMNYADEDDIMDEYIVPEFTRLQTFYRVAAANDQVVMVVFT